MNKGQHNNMKACMRGGNWDNSSDAGPSTVNLNNARTNSNNNVCRRDCVSKPETTMVDTGNIGMCCPAISEIKYEECFLSNFNVENLAPLKKTKRVGFLFERAFTMENLYAAFLDARKDKRKKRSTMKFEINLGAQLKALHEELHSDSYRPRAYVQFYVYEPKKRLIKRELKVKSYVRYVDDFIMIGLSLQEAKAFRLAAEKFVQDELGLELSHWHIQKIKRGINFVGYRTWKSIKFVRKHSIYKMKKAIKKVKLESIISLIGHAVSTGTMKYYRRLLINADVFKLLPTRSRQCLLNM